MGVRSETRATSSYIESPNCQPGRRRCREASYMTVPFEAHKPSRMVRIVDNARIGRRVNRYTKGLPDFELLQQPLLLPILVESITNQIEPVQRLQTCAE